MWMAHVASWTASRTLVFTAQSRLMAVQSAGSLAQYDVHHCTVLQVPLGSSCGFDGDCRSAVHCLTNCTCHAALQMHADTQLQVMSAVCSQTAGLCLSEFTLTVV
jgi:hypothetical protein